MPSSETESNVAVAESAAPASSTETVVIDGVIYTGDGEMIGLADESTPPAPGYDGDEAEADRILRSLTRTFHRKRAADAQFAALESELEAMRKAALEAIFATAEYQAINAEAQQCLNISRKAEDRLDWLKATYTDFLRLFALPRLTGKARTLETLAGSISLRKVAARLNIEDEARAVAALELVGESDAIERSVLKSRISDDLRAKLIAGEATLTGIAVVPETAKVGVSVGGVAIV